MEVEKREREEGGGRKQEKNEAERKEIRWERTDRRTNKRGKRFTCVQ